MTEGDITLMLSKVDNIQKNSIKIKIGAQNRRKIYIEFGYIPKMQMKYEVRYEKLYEVPH